MAQTTEHQHEEDGDDMMGDNGFDLSLLSKRPKPKNPNNSSTLGLSFASDISAITGDDPFKTDDDGDWKDGSWVAEGELEDFEDTDYDETMELLDRTMSDLKEISLEEQSVANRSAIGSAIENIKSSMADRDTGRLGGINKDLETIR